MMVNTHSYMLNNYERMKRKKMTFGSKNYMIDNKVQNN